MRCFFRHRWVVDKTYPITRAVGSVNAVVYYRTCLRCGSVQRGFDNLNDDIAWQALEKHSHFKRRDISAGR